MAESGGDGGRRDSDKGAQQVTRWHPVAPAGAFAAALIAGLGILSQVFPATNKDLTGLRLLLALLLASLAIVLVVESTYRARSQKRWGALGVVGTGAASVSLLIVLLPVSHGSADAGAGGGLRLSIRPSAPEFFHVAFRRPIPLPSAREDWAQLHQRGGIDVGDSRFQLILANQTSAPISVLNIRAEVVGSEPLPRGTDARRPSQGEEGLGQLTAVLTNDHQGNTGLVYEGTIETLDPAERATLSPYFKHKYISVEPGEVYPARLTVQAEPERTIRFRMIAEGKSAEGRFVAKTPVYRIVGRVDDPYQRRFARYYEKGYFPTECTPTPDNPWVDARHTAQSSACPHGLGRPFEMPLPKPSRFPPGELELSIGLTRGGQSVMISGVAVGSPPAARSTGGVILPLLRSLGAWTGCVVYSPTPNYWTARWDRWSLRLTFASEGATDCTPASDAGLREVDLDEAGAIVHTDLGSFEIGAPAAQVPAHIEPLLTLGAGSYYERDYVAPGVSVCDPLESDPARTQLDYEESPGGILVIHEDQSSTEISGITTDLPYGRC